MKGLKSRAAFKLLEVCLTNQSFRCHPTEPIFKINEKHKIFEKGQTVVDLVSFSQRDVI